MEKSTYIGIVLGFVAVFVGMAMKGANMAILLNGTAFMIIIVGTAATLFVGFPMSELKKFPKLLKIAFSEQKLMHKRDVISTFMEWATITRREGLLALEGHIDEIDESFMKNGMRMIIDGNDHDFVRDVLMEDIAATEERHRIGASIFTQAGTYAPTLGVLGAVVGLIGALGDLNNFDQLGASIAAAFVATLFGIFTGYVLWHPIANKLRRISQREIEIKLMIVEGLLSIQSGISTMAIEQKLSVYLSPTERAIRNQEREDFSGEQATQTA